MTLVGAAGAVGGAWLPALNTTVAISQMVMAPVPTLAAGVAPAPTTWSSASSLHVAGTRDIGPGGVAGSGGQSVAEARVGVEANGQLIGRCRWRRSGRTRRARRSCRAGGAGLLVDRAGAGRGR